MTDLRETALPEDRGAAARNVAVTSGMFGASLLAGLVAAGPIGAGFVSLYAFIVWRQIENLPDEDMKLDNDLDPDRLAFVRATAQRLADRAGIDVPVQLGMIEHSGKGKAQEAMRKTVEKRFFAGAIRHKDTVGVYFNRRLLNEAPDDEIEAVIAHEISHIARNDSKTMKSMAVAASGAGYACFVAGAMLIAGASGLLPPVIGLAGLMACFSIKLGNDLLSKWNIRQIELRADRDVASLGASPSALIRALNRFRAAEKALAKNPEHVDALEQDGWRTLFRTHPSRATRMAQLEALARAAGEDPDATTDEIEQTGMPATRRPADNDNRPSAAPSSTSAYPSPWGGSSTARRPPPAWEHSPRGPSARNRPRRTGNDGPAPH